MKKINLLDICHYQIKPPPCSGGQLRIFNLLTKLPNNFKITLLNQNISPEKRSLNKDIPQISLPVRRINLFLTKWLNYFGRKRQDEYSYVMYSFLPGFNNKLKQKINHYASKSDVIILNFPYLYSLIKKINHKLIIYNAHNVESEYLKCLLSKNIINKLIIQYIKHLERKTCRKADLIICCTAEDKNKLTSLYKIEPNKIIVIPNGVNVNEIKYKPQKNLKKEKDILFIGSCHKPNLEAVEFIINQLAPQLPKYNFIITGNVVKTFLDKTNHQINNFASSGNYLEQTNKIHGYGWHVLETWPDGTIMRWARKNFGFLIKDKKISSLYFKTNSRKKIKGEVFVNHKKIGIFTTHKAQQEFNFNLNEHSDHLMIEIKLEKIWQPFGDPRQLGIAIYELGYYKSNKQYRIPLNQIYNFSSKLNHNITLIEDLSEDHKKLLLANSDLALNPMFSGSGSNLKMFEYMAAGLPVVTTQIGARGIEGHNEKHFIISKPEDFKENIPKLLTDNELYKSVQSNARKLVEEKYNWQTISQKLARIIQQNPDK